MTNKNIKEKIEEIKKPQKPSKDIEGFFYAGLNYGIREILSALEEIGRKI